MTPQGEVGRPGDPPERNRHDHCSGTDSASAPPHRLIFGGLGVVVVAAVAVGIVLAVRGGGTGTAFSTGLKGSGVAATQTRTVPAFAAVDLAGANEVGVHVGSTQAVTVHGDDNLIDYVTTTVQAGTLAIGQSRGFSTKSPMSVEITVPALDAVTLSGAGVLDVDGVKADHFSVRAPGSGTLSVTGRPRPSTRPCPGRATSGSTTSQHTTRPRLSPAPAVSWSTRATASTRPSRASARSSTPAARPSSRRTSPAPEQSPGSSSGHASANARRVRRILVDHAGRIPDRSQTRGSSGTSRSRTPGLDLSRLRTARRRPHRDSALAIAARTGPTSHSTSSPIAAHLDAAERPNRLEDDENAPWISRQVAELEIALGDHHLERSVVPAKPDRRNERTAVLPIGRQDGGGGSLQERAHAVDPGFSHVVEPTRRRRGGSRAVPAGRARGSRPASRSGRGGGGTSPRPCPGRARGRRPGGRRRAAGRRSRG